MLKNIPDFCGKDKQDAPLTMKFYNPHKGLNERFHKSPYVSPRNSKGPSNPEQPQLIPFTRLIPKPLPHTSNFPLQLPHSFLNPRTNLVNPPQTNQLLIQNLHNLPKNIPSTPGPPRRRINLLNHPTQPLYTLIELRIHTFGKGVHLFPFCVGRLHGFSAAELVETVPHDILIVV